VIAWTLNRERGLRVTPHEVQAALTRMQKRGQVSMYQGATHRANPVGRPLYRAKGAS
jgi:hypothetical protein